MLVALVGLMYLLMFACSIASLVFFIMVLIQMFKRDQSTMGIVCIVLTICGGIGPLIAFVFGWMKATEWDIKKVMTYWTVAIVVQLVVIVVIVVASIAAVGATIEQQDFDFDPDNLEFEFEVDDSEFEIPDFEMPDDANFGEPEPVESATE